MGDLSTFAKQAELIAESDAKASLIRGHANTGRGNAHNGLSAVLTTAGAHGASTPVDIGPQIMSTLTQDEFYSIMTMFAKAQDRITRRLARTMDEHYGVVIEGLTPEADDAHL